MTDITRLFHVATRGFTGMERKYSGQIYDSQSTTLHFEYDPVDFLKKVDEDEYWIPYIQFAVYDGDGNPLTYGPDPTTSQPTFDGYTFEIPYDVTSRAKSQRVEYQLFFVKNTVAFDPERQSVAQLDRTEYLLSTMDGIAIKPSITCKPKSKKCCPPLGPQSEPSIVGYIDMWKKYGLVVPVDCGFSVEEDSVTFDFHTYDGQNDFTVYMNRLPYLDDDRIIPPKFLPFLKTWMDDEHIDDTHIPTALLVKGSIDDLEARKTDKVMAIVYWNGEWEYSKGSTVIYSDERSGENIYISKRNNNIGHPPTDTEYWSCVVEYDVIVNDWNVAKVDNVPSTIIVRERFEKVESDIRTLFETKVDKTSIDTFWQAEPSDERIPSSKLAKSAIDDLNERKTDKTMAIPIWDSEEVYNYQSVVIWQDEVYISTKDGNVGVEPTLDSVDWSTIVEFENIATAWNQTPTDRIVPSEKLVATEFDGVHEDISELNDRTQANSDAIDTLKQRVDRHDTRISDMETWRSAVDERITFIERDLEAKTPIDMAIYPWSEFRAYRTDSTVICGSVLFISVQDANIGNNPLDDDGTWWVEISGSGGTGGNVSAKSIQFGNNTDTEYILTHGLNTYDFLWSLRSNDDSRRYATADIYAYDRMKVRISLYAPPGDNALVINLVGAKSGSSRGAVEIVDVVTPATVWTYDNTSGTPVFVQTYDSTGNDITADVSQISTDGFTPVTMEYSDAQSGSMVVCKTSEFLEFDNKSTWIIPHATGKFVLVQQFTDAYGNVLGDVSQDGNNVAITFNQPLSGFVAMVIPDTDAIYYDNQSVWEFQHMKGRLVMVQTYDSTGNQIFGDVQCTDETVTVTFNVPQSGYLVFQ